MVDSESGAEGIRTPGLVNASHALCQLSYSPLKWESRCYGISYQPVNRAAGILGERFTDTTAKKAYVFVTTVLLRYWILSLALFSLAFLLCRLF